MTVTSIPIQASTSLDIAAASVQGTQRRSFDPSWEICPVHRGDLADLKRLFLKLHLYNGSLDPRFALADDWERHFDTMMERALAGEGRLALLARDRAMGRPLGFALAALQDGGPLWKHRDGVEVEALYVERAWRGTGLSEALLAAALSWAEDLGQPVVQLYVTAGNERAIRFYERQGFRAVQMLLAKSRRKREPSASRHQGGHARGPRDGTGPLSEPGGQARDVEGGAGQQMLQAGLRQAAIAGMA